MSDKEKNVKTVQEPINLGDVHIADEVVAIIASLAANEVEGVASTTGYMDGYLKKDFSELLGVKNLSKGAKVDIIEGVVTVTLSLSLKFNYSVMDVSEKVQEKVKTAIENMTSLEVADVNIRVTGIEMGNQS